MNQIKYNNDTYFKENFESIQNTVITKENNLYIICPNASVDLVQVHSGEKRLNAAIYFDLYIGDQNAYRITCQSENIYNTFGSGFISLQVINFDYSSDIDNIYTIDQNGNENLLYTYKNDPLGNPRFIKPESALTIQQTTSPSILSPVTHDAKSLIVSKGFTQPYITSL